MYNEQGWVEQVDSFIEQHGEDGVRVDIEPLDNGECRVHYEFAEGEELQRVFGCQPDGSVYEIDHDGTPTLVGEGLRMSGSPLTCLNESDLPDILYEETCQRIPGALVICSELYHGLAIE